MKNFIKKLIVLITTFSLLTAILIAPTKASAKNTYWLTGVSKAAGGTVRMYYSGNTIKLQGKIKKAASENKVYDAVEKKSSYKLKIKDNCKITFIESENTQTITYGQWRKNNGYKDNNEISLLAFISVTLKVEGKKIKRIYFSA